MRQAEANWLLSYADTLESMMQLPNIDCTLLLADVYNKVKFEPDDSTMDA